MKKFAKLICEFCIDTERLIPVIAWPLALVATWHSFLYFLILPEVENPKDGIFETPLYLAGYLFVALFLYYLYDTVTYAFHIRALKMENYLSAIANNQNRVTVREVRTLIKKYKFYTKMSGAESSKYIQKKFREFF